MFSRKQYLLSIAIPLLISLFNPLNAQDFDILLLNGRIINGTGNAWFKGDLGIKAGKIAAIGQLKTKTASKTIDVENRVIAPGFIDVHGHIEGSIFRRPTADNFIYDDVTTIITGNCGSASDDLTEFFRKLDSARVSINVASLAGHNTIRRQAVGLENIYLISSGMLCQ